MEPRSEPTPPSPVLRREVERPGNTGHGLLPVVVLAAAMTSTLAAAALAMSLAPRASHCPRAGRYVAPVALPAPAAPVDDSFARPVPPVGRPAEVRLLHVPAPAIDTTCGPRVRRAGGELQELTFETCASAPMPRSFELSPR